MVESFALTAVVDGQTVTPPGWMWVFGFALGGCEWAIHECETEEFKARVRQWLKDNKAHHLQASIKECEQKLADLRQELHLTEIST